MACVSGGGPALWLTEWLIGAMTLKPGMRVLDLGCGRAASSIFLRREYGVEVWATDLWFSASENLQRIVDAGVADAVFPIHADARALPFADGFFDAIICIDSYVYFGTDDFFLGNITRFVKPGGQLGVAGAGLMKEIEGPVPVHLAKWWTPELWCLHSPNWWRRHWECTGIVKLEVCDAMSQGWELWRDWHRAIAPDNRLEIDALEADQGEFLGYVRMVGRRDADVTLAGPIEAIPAQYVKKPLIKEREG